MSGKCSCNAAPYMGEPVGERSYYVNRTRRVRMFFVGGSVVG